MLTIDQILKTLNTHPALSECKTHRETGKTIRLDIPENNIRMRGKIADIVKSLFENTTTPSNRPFDVKIVGGFTCLVKPAKGAQKTASGAFFGALSEIDLSQFDTSSFSAVCSIFSAGKLPTKIKENSDVQAVSDLNKAISQALNQSSSGIDLRIEGHTFKNVIGCVPVTVGEPKADVVLVCRNGNKLYPDGYISYKMGTGAKDFQNYSGLSVRSAKEIFKHPEVQDFYSKLHALSVANKKEEIFQEIRDGAIIGLALWGKDFVVGKRTFGVDNCSFIAQGKAKIVGSQLMYDHVQNNGDFNFSRSYEPVFGARYASGRNNIGPDGTTANNFRIGIFPRAYRSEWMK